MSAESIRTQPTNDLLKVLDQYPKGDMSEFRAAMSELELRYKIMTLVREFRKPNSNN